MVRLRADTPGELSVTASAQEFAAFLRAARYGTKLGKGNIAREDVRFMFDGTRLLINFMGVLHAISARGAWRGTVIVAPRVIKALRDAPPTQDPLIIGYRDSRLRIGTTLLPASWSP